MFPTLFTQHTNFGDIPYNTYGLMITIAFLAAALTAHRRVAKVGIDPDKMVPFYLLILFAGIIGSRILHFAMSAENYTLGDFFDLSKGGLAFYGGFIFAGIAGISYGFVQKMNVWKLADAVGPTVMLGLSLGRLGCFAAGCCHGQVFDLPADAHALLPESFSGGQLYVMDSFPFLGMVMEHGVGKNHVPVYPTQLWESLAAISIFGVASLLWMKRRFDGEVIGVVLMMYAIWRPINESLRGDDVRGTGYFGLLTTSQVISIPVFLLGLVILLIQFRKGLSPETPFQPPTASEDIGAAPRF